MHALRVEGSCRTRGGTENTTGATEAVGGDSHSYLQKTPAHTIFFLPVYFHLTEPLALEDEHPPLKIALSLSIFFFSCFLLLFPS